MFQLTKGELEIFRSQFVMTSIPAENQADTDWKSQNVISNSVKMGMRKQPYAFTEQGVAMLSSVLRSPLAIQMNIGIMRAFVAIRHMVNTLPQPDATADVAQLRKDFENLKLDIEDILHDQNDINESTRAQLDAISEALTELQGNGTRSSDLPEIGFAAIQKRREEQEGKPTPPYNLFEINKLALCFRLSSQGKALRRCA